MSAKFDILYNDASVHHHKSNYMDLTAPSGFMLLVENYATCSIGFQEVFASAVVMAYRN